MRPIIDIKLPGGYRIEGFEGKECWLTKRVRSRLFKCWKVNKPIAQSANLDNLFVFYLRESGLRTEDIFRAYSMGSWGVTSVRIGETHYKVADLLQGAFDALSLEDYAKYQRE